jgi:ParB family chromosome partitioning protein
VPPRKTRKKKAESQSRGLMPAQVAAGSPPAPAEALRRAVEEDGGQVLAVFRDPLGGNWQILAALPIDKVAPTPYQRDLSESHVKRLTAVLDALDRFLDPIIAVRGAQEGTGRPTETTGWRPPGLGGRSILALVLADPDVAYKILALTREGAQPAREVLEVIRMARDPPRSATRRRRTSRSSSRSPRS